MLCLSQSVLPFSPDLPTVFSLPGLHHVERGSLITTLDTLGTEWEVSFLFMPVDYICCGFASLLELSEGDNENPMNEKENKNYGLKIMFQKPGNRGVEIISSSLLQV